MEKMAKDKRERPQFFGCLIGTGVGIVLTFAVITALGIGLRVFMVLPAWLGFITPLLPEDVVPVEIPGTTELELGETRHYFIFTQRRVAANYDLNLESVATGMPVELRRASRTIQYETEAVTGTLLYHFTIDQPGTYRLHADQARYVETLLIAPDHTGRNQTVLMLFYTPLLITFCGSAWLLWKRGTRADVTQAQSKRERWATWLDGGQP